MQRKSVEHRLRLGDLLELDGSRADGLGQFLAHPSGNAALVQKSLGGGTASDFLAAELSIVVAVANAPEA